MLNTEDRTTIVNYLASDASDAVIVEAFENARRENSHALVTLVNYQNELRSSKARKEKVVETAPVQETVVTTMETVNPLLPDDKLPSKLTVVGQEVIAALTRVNIPASMHQISKLTARSVTQIRPQLALAIKRGLITHLRNDLFTVLK